MRESLLKHVLATRFSAGVSFEWDALRRFLHHPRWPHRAAQLKAELKDAILNHRISPAEFEALTSVDQGSQADVDAFLRTELWEPLYAGEPLAP